MYARMIVRMKYGGPSLIDGCYSKIIEIQFPALSFPTFLTLLGSACITAYKSKQRPCLRECHENINQLLVDDHSFAVSNNKRTGYINVTRMSINGISIPYNSKPF